MPDLEDRLILAKGRESEDPTAPGRLLDRPGSNVHRRVVRRERHRDTRCYGFGPVLRPCL